MPKIRAISILSWAVSVLLALALLVPLALAQETPSDDTPTTETAPAPDQVPSSPAPITEQLPRNLTVSKEWVGAFTNFRITNKDGDTNDPNFLRDDANFLPDVMHVPNVAARGIYKFNFDMGRVSPGTTYVVTNFYEETPGDWKFSWKSIPRQIPEGANYIWHPNINENPAAPAALNRHIARLELNDKVAFVGFYQPVPPS